MTVRDPKLRYVWDQKAIPVALRRKGIGEQIRVRIPKSEDNQLWLRNNRRRIPKWKKDGEYWELPKKWFTDFVERALQKYGKVYIIQPFVETEICAYACQHATKHECQCSCMGANHGSGNSDGWFEVNEAFSIRTTKPYLACRLLKSTKR